MVHKDPMTYKVIAIFLSLLGARIALTTVCLMNRFSFDWICAANSQMIHQCHGIKSEKYFHYSMVFPLLPECNSHRKWIHLRKSIISEDSKDSWLESPPTQI